MQIVRLGTERQANVVAAGDQNQPAIAVLDGGGYVVAWSDGGADAVRARLFDVDGVPAGGEILLNQGGLSPQAPTVAALEGGGLVAAWADYAADADGAGIRVRRFDAAGRPAGDAVLANAATGGHQLAPSIAVLAGGGFVLAWTSPDPGGTGIVARLFGADGQPAGPEIAVNAATAGDQAEPVVTGLAGGAFLVAWTDAQGDADGGGIRLRAFNAAGQPLPAEETLVNATTAGAQAAPTLAALAGGNVVLAWTSGAGTPTATVRLRVFEAATQSWGAETALRDADPGSSEPAVAPLADGGFVVTWSTADGNGQGIVARRFDTVGAPQGAAFAVNADPRGFQGTPAVTGLQGDGFAVAWIDNRDSASLEIRAQAFGIQHPPEGAVAVAGVPIRGQTLSADPAGLTDRNGLGVFSHRWERSDGQGGWSAIGGARDADYVPVGADVGRQVRVVLSYVDGQGTAESVAGAGVAVVARAVPVAAPRDGVARLELDSAGLAARLADRDVLVPPDGSATVALLDGGLNFGDATPTAFVVRLYQGLLERAPDAAGLAYWTHVLEQGGDRPGVVSGLLGGGEYAARHAGEDARAFVGHLYGGLLGRQSETGGLEYWTGRLEAGLSRAALTADFADSGEARTHWRAVTGGGLFTPDFEAGIVRAAYGTLGREADAGAVAHFRAVLEGGAGLGALGDALEGSGEFRARHGALGDRGFVEAVFRGVLGREADAAGRDYFVDLLGRGAADRGDVVAGLAASGEAQARLSWALPHAAEPAPPAVMALAAGEVWPA